MKLLIILTALGLSTGSLVQECHPRDYGNGASVCVCNVTHCDRMPSIMKTPAGLVTVYSTSKSGDRFAITREHFNKSSNITTAIQVNIDRTRRYQQIVGFGGAFTDATGINIAKLPQKLQTRLIQDYFDRDGLEYSLARVPIGGADFSSRAYSYDDDHPGDQTLSKFSLQPEDYKYKIPYIHLAQKYSPDGFKLFASPWSAPAWMKTNNQLNHGGFLIGKPGEKYYKLFAKYVIKFLQEYKRNNISFWSMTIENEPSFGWDKNYAFNSMGFNSTLERDYIKLDLGPELQKSGFENLKLMIYDDNILTLFGLRLDEFANTVLSDPEAAKYVSGVAFHWYANFIANRSDLIEIHSKFPNHFLLSTEACEEWSGKQNHVSLGNWATAVRYADDIIKDLNHYAAGWIDWNLALDLQGGPNWVKNFVDAPVIVNETSQEYYKQPFFYALGHFSKFLPVGSTRLNHTMPAKESENVEVTVFERPDNATVLVVLNTNHQAVELSIHDPSNGYVDISVKGDSIQTVIWY